MNTQTGWKRNIDWLILALLVAAGAFFRFHDLGLSAFRGDTILMWNLARSRAAPSLLLTKWFETSGAMGQMPMPAFFMQLMLYLLELPVTPATTRMSFALWGVFSVAAAFFAGRRLGGRGLGFLLAALVAASPFAVYFSREAYFYSSLLLGYVLFLWAALAIGERLWTRQRLGPGDGWLLAAALFFTGYSQMTGLFLCTAGGLYFLVLWLRFQRGARCFWPNAAIVAGIYLVVFVPLLIAEWGPRQILDQLGSSLSNMSKSIVARSGDNLLVLVRRMFTQFFWGKSALGLTCLAVSLLGAGWSLARRREPRLWILVYFVVIQLLLFAATRSILGAFYEARYVGGTFPFLLALMAYGLLVGLPDLLGTLGVRRARWIGVAAGAAAAAALVAPALLVTQLTGKPTPYFELVEWADSHLPRGTPVLVDRWFEPWNELKAHPSTNQIFYTFTIPNEPVEVYIQNRWRDSARDFFGRFPDAAYLDIAKSYQHLPEVGPWAWPAQFFDGHVAITNEAGLKLRNLGLGFREDFNAATTNRVIVEFYYNSRSNILAKARAAGMPAVALFGRGWTFVKPMGDPRSWRVLEDQGEAVLCNLTDGPLTVKLLVRGATLDGTKKVAAGDQVAFTFEPNQWKTWEVGPILIQPGESTLVLRDMLWPLAQVRLLVEPLLLQPAPQAPPPANPTPSAPSPAQ